MSAVQIQQEGAVRILVNNNPAARNAITPDLRQLARSADRGRG